MILSRSIGMHYAVRVRFVVIAVAATFGVVGCPVTNQAPEPGDVAAELVVDDLLLPLFVTAPPGDTGRIFIVQQGGAIEVVDLASENKGDSPFLDLTGWVTTADHQGLLGMAFHPDYFSNGHFFVFYTALEGDAVIARYTVSANPNIADMDSRMEVLRVPMSDPRHNGGMLTFGPDGYLYIGIADDFKTDASQDRSNVLGTILRIDVDGASGYAIPNDNPYVGNGSGWREEIWSYGLRNSWRFSFDRETGDLWISDTGDQSREELNFQSAGVDGGQNYGWDIAEGSQCRGGTGSCGTNPGFTPPIFDYAHDESMGWVIIGGYVYRGAAIPSVRGLYFFADFRTRRVWTIHHQGDIVTDLTDRTAELKPNGGLDIDTITSFGEDASGELYLVDFGDGEVFRIVSR